MGNPKCKRKAGRIIIVGSNTPPGIVGTGVPVRRSKPSLKSYSEEIPPERVTLRCTQSRAARKSAKPTLPKMPWD